MKLKRRKMEQIAMTGVTEDVPLRLESVIDKAVGAVVGAETLRWDGHDMTWPWMGV
jgi:hypothetical protein